MVDLANEIVQRGGAAKACELLAAGATRGTLRSAIRTGLAVRPRKGWYVLPTTSPRLRGAVRVGGRATCQSALAEYGVWITDPHHLLHVVVHRSTSQLRSVATPRVRQSSQPDAIVHWRFVDKPRELVGSRLLQTPIEALMDARDCLPAEDLFAAAESLRRRRLVSPAEWGAALARAPRRVRKILAPAGDKSDSGLESLAMFRLRRRNLRIRQQVQIGPDRVDLVIGSRLVVELDGEGYHDRRKDYRRDARLVASGYVVLRFDYHQVLSEWATVERAVDAVTRSRRHLR
jgi:very-short-patch-repair endonuclease